MTMFTTCEIEAPTSLYASSMQSLMRSRRFRRLRKSARRFDSPALSGLRMWPVPHFEHWLIFYIPTDTAVQIVRVLHGARDLPTILDR